MRIPAAAVRELFQTVGAGSRRGVRLPASAARKLGLDTVPSGCARRTGSDAFDPQERLAAELRTRLGAEAVRTEVTGLIPGRRYRADIVIAAAQLVIEFDGFQYHRSKAAFQSDRQRQNAFVAQGWRVLRFFHAQVRNDLAGVVEQILQVCARSVAACAGDASSATLNLGVLHDQS